MKSALSKPFDSFWIVFLLTAVFFEPQYVQDCLPQVDTVFFICKIIALAFLFFLGIAQYRYSPLFVLIMVFEVYLIGNTFFQSGATLSMVKIAIDVLALFLIVDFGLKNNAKNTLNAISWVFLILIGISMVTSVLYPDGLYLATGTTRIEQLNATRYFLGHKNQALVLTMAGLACCCMRDIYIKGTLGKLSILAACMALINVVAQNSINSILIVTCFIVLASIISIKRIGNINPYILILIAVVADVLVVGFQAHAYIGDFIASLGKDVSLTHRTDIWDIAVSVLRESPLFGYGLENSGMAALRFAGYGSPHNYFYAQMYYGGVVALVFIASIFLCVLKKLRKHPCVAASLLACILMLMLLQGIAESFSVGIVRFVLVLALAYNIDLIDVKKENKKDEPEVKEKRGGIKRVPC